MMEENFLITWGTWPNYYAIVNTVGRFYFKCILCDAYSPVLYTILQTSRIEHMELFLLLILMLVLLLLYSVIPYG